MLHDLVESVREYQRAAQLEPKQALYWLGLGWMLEQAAAYATEVNAPFLPKLGKATTDSWLKQALAVNRRAYDLSLQQDLGQEHFGPATDYSISLETGEGILRILGRHPLNPAGRAEVDRVRESLQTLNHKPRAVTPIIFSLNGPTPLHALLAPDTVVPFDLAGDGGGEKWPWVGPSTGILVWDPKKTGQIVSGRQLFGSVTWWMFWKNGYQALAALDDDENGWLEGRELDGLAVWRDRNGNGIADPGEVVPLSQFGITRVAVRAIGRSGGALFNPRGLQRRDGTLLPTYDWAPTPLSSSPRRTAVR
jgi:hypothetical protein